MKQEVVSTSNTESRAEHWNVDYKGASRLIGVGIEEHTVYRKFILYLKMFIIRNNSLTRFYTDLCIYLF